MNNTSTKPKFYACVLSSLTEIARQNGYALAVHGSMAKDLDLIAVRWTMEATEPDELVRLFSKDLGSTSFDCTIMDKEERFGNQTHYTISIFGDWFVDLTVIF